MEWLKPLIALIQTMHNSLQSKMPEAAVQIRSAQLCDTDALNTILNRCATAMADRGMHHWMGVYTPQIVQAQIQDKHVFVLEHTARIVGCVCLGRQRPEYYDSCWPDAPSADWYLQMFAVDPECQGEGMGQRLMHFVRQTFPNQTIQLDAVTHNLALTHFYQQQGFTQIAEGIGLGDHRALWTFHTAPT